MIVYNLLSLETLFVASMGYSLKYFWLPAILILGTVQCYPAGNKDTVSAEPVHSKYLKPYHRNVIKFNPTPMLFLANVNNITLSYERLIKDNQSVCIQAGYLLFPKIYSDTVLGLIDLKGGEKKGVNLSADYRFYPMKRNRRPAPDGMYLGAYISYYGFKFKNPFDILYTQADQGGALKGKINVVNVGMELGYQFIFWKRISLDLLMFGPSLSYYNRELIITGNLDESQITRIDDELVKKLMEKFPLIRELFTTEDIKFTGSRTNFSVGFRYSISIGFHF